MSRITRGNARRRISLLATSSLVATSLLSGAATLTAVTLAPSAALAACLPDPAGTAGVPLPASGGESCVGADTGIAYTATGDLTVLMEGAPVTDWGVFVDGTGGTVDLKLG
ncbi:MAG TPA: hypothetical protein VFE03_05640, partial [Caulobacteraceae bacterium]|nr:hypothetical protein [Caulobacteraceae bacterium]